MIRYKIVKIIAENNTLKGINVKKNDLWFAKQYSKENYILISKLSKTGKLIGQTVELILYPNEVQVIKDIKAKDEVHFANTIDTMNLLKGKCFRDLRN